MNDQQRLTIGEKLLDFANIGAGAMIFGMAMSEKGFNINLAVGGVIFLDYYGRILHIFY